MYSFTANELNVFKKIGQGNFTASEVAEECDLSLRAAYGVLTSLSRKKVVDICGRRNRAYVTSDRLHALALRRFTLEDERPLDCLVGAKLPLLLSIYKNGKERERIAFETHLKTSSVRRLIVQLSNYGLIEKDDDRYRVPKSDPIQTFLSDFAYGSCLTIMEEVTERGILRWHSGLEVVFSTNAPVLAENVRPTGLTAIAGSGLSILPPSYYYQMSYWNSGLTVEEVVVHEIAVADIVPRAIAFAVLYLKSEGFDQNMFVNEAEWRGLGPVAKNILGYMHGEVITDPTFPEREEIDQLLDQYGVSR